MKPEIVPIFAPFLPTPFGHLPATDLTPPGHFEKLHKTCTESAQFLIHSALDIGLVPIFANFLPSRGVGKSTFLRLWDRVLASRSLFSPRASEIPSVNFSTCRINPLKRSPAPIQVFKARSCAENMDDGPRQESGRYKTGCKMVDCSFGFSFAFIYSEVAITLRVLLPQNCPWHRKEWSSSSNSRKALRNGQEQNRHSWERTIRDNSNNKMRGRTS